MTRPFKTETPMSIYLWGEETFGVRSSAQIAARTSLEVVELVMAVLNEHAHEKQVEELADVAVMSWQLAVAHSVDARPVPSVSFVNAYDDTPLAYTLALSRSFSTYVERLVCQRVTGKGSEPAEWLKKTLMVLEAIAQLLNVDLPSIVDAKMEINRARVWAKLDNGHFQHKAA